MLLPLALAVALPACAGEGELAGVRAAPVANGPAADYPIVMGDPYVINGTAYTPADIWNYDEVAYAAYDAQGGNGITVAHRTLPLPSYVEVTSLETGRTILARVERRGPMSGASPIALSPGAMRQLGANSGTPVRIRRVNPPEPERAALRSGAEAPLRMDTPISLVNVLRRKLPGGAAPVSEISVAGSATTPSMPLATQVPPPVTATAGSSLALPPLQPLAVPAAVPSRGQVATYSYDDGYFVQAGAFSTRDRAERVARSIGGEVSRSGSLWRVRTGPFSTVNSAQASLAKVRAAGYSDARIYSGG